MQNYSQINLKKVPNKPHNSSRERPTTMGESNPHNDSSFSMSHPRIDRKNEPNQN